MKFPPGLPPIFTVVGGMVIAPAQDHLQAPFRMDAVPLLEAEAKIQHRVDELKAQALEVRGRNMGTERRGQ